MLCLSLSCVHKIFEIFVLAEDRWWHSIVFIELLLGELGLVLGLLVLLGELGLLVDGLVNRLVEIEVLSIWCRDVESVERWVRSVVVVTDVFPGIVHCRIYRWQCCFFLKT